jgi:hypothetical protein
MTGRGVLTGDWREWRSYLKHAIEVDMVTTMRRVGIGGGWGSEGQKNDEGKKESDGKVAIELNGHCEMGLKSRWTSRGRGRT